MQAISFNLGLEKQLENAELATEYEVRAQSRDQWVCKNEGVCKLSRMVSSLHGHQQL